MALESGTKVDYNPAKSVLAAKDLDNPLAVGQAWPWEAQLDVSVTSELLTSIL